MRLLSIPWTTAGRAQFRDDFAQFFKSRHSERSAAESKNPVASLFNFNTRFLGFARNDICSNPPQRAVRAELRDFTGRSFADVNGDANHADESADEHKSDKQRRDVANPQRP